MIEHIGDYGYFTFVYIGSKTPFSSCYVTSDQRGYFDTSRIKDQMRPEELVSKKKHPIIR